MTNGPDGAYVCYSDVKPGYVINEQNCLIMWLVLSVVEREDKKLEVFLINVETLEKESWIAPGDYPFLSLDDDLIDENGQLIVEGYGSSDEKVHQVV